MAGDQNASDLILAMRPLRDGPFNKFQCRLGHPLKERLRVLRAVNSDESRPAEERLHARIALAYRCLLESEDIYPEARASLEEGELMIPKIEATSTRARYQSSLLLAAAFLEMALDRGSGFRRDAVLSKLRSSSLRIIRAYPHAAMNVMRGCFLSAYCRYFEGRDAEAQEILNDGFEVFTAPLDGFCSTMRERPNLWIRTTETLSCLLALDARVNNKLKAVPLISASEPFRKSVRRLHVNATRSPAIRLTR